MRKAVLNPNPFTNAKQDFQVEGLSYANRIIQRDAITSEVGQIDRPDKTVVSNGRTEPGEFSITLDPADTNCRQEFYSWYLMSIDGRTSLQQGREERTLGAEINDFDYGKYDNNNSRTIPGVDDIVGIDGAYKRKAIITMYRLYRPGSNSSIGDSADFGLQNPIRIMLHGCFCKSIEFNEYDMESDDAATFSCTISYDDVDMLFST